MQRQRESTPRLLPNSHPAAHSLSRFRNHASGIGTGTRAGPSLSLPIPRRRRPLRGRPFAGSSGRLRRSRDASSFIHENCMQCRAQSRDQARREKMSLRRVRLRRSRRTADVGTRRYLAMVSLPRACRRSRLLTTSSTHQTLHGQHPFQKRGPARGTMRQGGLRIGTVTL